MKRSAVTKVAAGVSVAALLLLTGCDVPGVYRPPRPATGGPYVFYVSPDGDDGNDGLSPEKPWRTLDHANSVRFQPGDRLRLKGGKRFRGSVTLDKGEAGSPAQPVVIESYGKGRATIAPRGSSGITVRNTAGVEVRNVSLVGDAKALREGVGIAFRNSLPGGRRLDHIRITDVEARGFQNGISIGAEKGATAGYGDVRISGVSVHHNLESGLAFYGPAFEADRPAYAHTGLRIDRAEAYSNTGDPKSDRRNTGSGIVLGSVRDAKVTRSVAHDNGARSSAAAQEGPEGIWVYDSTRVVLENNKSYRNRTGSRVDGGGFGLDNNVSSSVVQYNLAYGNDGPGFLVYSGQATGAHRNNVVRFNMSWDDARKLPEYGGIVAYGSHMKNLDIYHNTVVMRTAGLASAEDAGAKPPALRLRDGISGVRVHNNIFATDGGPLLLAESPYGSGRVRLQGNVYHSTGRWSVGWGGRSFTALDGWRGASGQETLSGGPTGSSGDPCLPALTVPLADGADAGDLVPGCAGEVSVGRGPQAWGVDMGPVDYFGNRVPRSLTAGAAQPRTAD
ncbi:right-handed parallel beta-helix repeat-containing protein [Streptomyces sp. C11-1]|uniref:Right-handed parallel beta-helix repeat-containing protein n=1 Tax=Streptomyces durocortorensis TaxID=2811104 RepID=A0ABY9W5L9_9ACTN|nr:right-handed parallel beta-helix repeat-containing protein [Streptomyces durocortorensis]WNF31474.1 right-handed parallel beta-helix repeat-containing protein [Streptomyces durocortorensis]